MNEVPGKDKLSQHARFVETARKLGVDEDKERFEAKLGKIAQQKPRESARNLEKNQRKASGTKK